MDAAWEALQVARAPEPNFLSPARLHPLHELNDAFLQLMVDSAHRSTTDSGPLLIATLREDLCRLDTLARHRLAKCPVALVDLGFAELARWESLPQGGPPPKVGSPVVDAFPRLPSTQVAYGALTLAWTQAQTSRESACIIFGMTPECVASLSALGLQRLQVTAERHPEWVRPRWEAQPRVWSTVLRMALEPTPAQSPSLSLYLLQRQLADLVPESAVSRATRADTRMRSDRR